MAFKVHIIHDLMYGFTEPTSPEDLQLPDVDLVILNGNIGYIGKRSWHYAYQIANLYPNIQFVFNDGVTERYQRIIDKNKHEYEDAMSVRQTQDKSWPSNLHWKDPRDEEGLLILLQTGQTVAVWPCFGFPNVVSYDDWDSTWFYKNIAKGQIPVRTLESDLLPNSDLKLYGDRIVWSDPEFIKNHFIDQDSKLRNWETKQIAYKHYGIVVTHLNPYADPRLDNVKYSPYKIHLKGTPDDSDRLWVTTNQEKNINFLGAKLCSNPGRGSIARGKVIEVDGV
jgi:hypothetical protein|tara:strand:+ start:828 stop:1670 length:843 start_codon:yes stop_codon:yes gene_type:complete